MRSGIRKLLGKGGGSKNPVLSLTERLESQGKPAHTTVSAPSPGLANIDLYLALATGIWLNVPQPPQAGYPKCMKSAAHVGVVQSVLAKWETAQITTPGPRRRGCGWPRFGYSMRRRPVAGGDRIAGRGLWHVTPGERGAVAAVAVRASVRTGGYARSHHDLLDGRPPRGRAQIRARGNV